MLTRIRLENFKSWRELDIELAPITLLFGTNSSGKSSVLQALLLLKQTAEAESRSKQEVLNFGGGAYDYVNLGSFRDVIHEHDETSTLVIGFEWKWGIFFTSDEPYIKNNAIQHFSQLAKDRQLGMDNQVWGLEHIFLLQDGQLDGRLSYYKPIEDDVKSYADNYYIVMDTVHYLGPVRVYPKRTYQWTGIIPGRIGWQGEDTLEMLIGLQRAKVDNELTSEISRWLRKMGIADALELRPLDDRGRFYEPIVIIDGHENALIDVGFGLSQVLPVLVTLLAAPPGSIILLEQPELHLHPGAQAHLADLMLHAAETRQIQLIVESHSEHLLRRLQRRIAETEHDYANPDHIKLYVCERGDEGSNIQPVDVDAYGQIRNWPPDFFGDMAGELDALTRAALARRRQELSGGE